MSARVAATRARLDPLRRQRDELLRELRTLCELPSASSAAAEPLLAFPDVLLEGEQCAWSQRARDAVLQGSAQAKRLAVEKLLRDAGLLVRRSLQRDVGDYTDEDLPAVIVEATRGKPNVLGRRLLGATRQSDGCGDLKILKKFDVEDFKKIKREVLTAKRVAHAGIVAAELAFVDEGEFFYVPLHFTRILITI